MFEKLLCDHRANGVASKVFRPGAATAIAMPTGKGISTARLQWFTQHVALYVG